MRHIVIATHNTHKTEEIRAGLTGIADVEDLSAHPGIPPADETGTTFLENATIKAVAASRLLPAETLVLSDDSGLQVDALNGQPGVRSARYAGENATDTQNRARLMEELRKSTDPGTPRSARFRCCMALARNGSLIGSFEGTVEGTIAPRERGEGGFGYDPVFIPIGHQQSFGELPAELKNRLSHRARALEKVLAWFGAACAGGDPGVAQE